MEDKKTETKKDWTHFTSHTASRRKIGIFNTCVYNFKAFAFHHFIIIPGFTDSDCFVPRKVNVMNEIDWVGIMAAGEEPASWKGVANSLSPGRYEDPKLWGLWSFKKSPGLRFLYEISSLLNAYSWFILFLSAGRAKGNIYTCGQSSTCNIDSLLFSRMVILKMWSVDPRWSRRSFQGGCTFKTSFTITVKYFFHCTDICTSGTKEILGKIAVALAWIKAVSPEHTSNHCFIHQHMLTIKCFKIPVVFKSTISKA